MSLCQCHPMSLSLCVSVTLCHCISVTMTVSLCQSHCACVIMSVSLCQSHCACVTITVPVLLCLCHCVSVTVCHLVAAFVLLRVCGEVRVDKTKSRVMKLEAHCHTPLVTLKHTNQSAVSSTQPSAPAPAPLHCSSACPYTPLLLTPVCPLKVEYEPFKFL